MIDSLVKHRIRSENHKFYNISIHKWITQPWTRTSFVASCSLLSCKRNIRHRYAIIWCFSLLRLKCAECFFPFKRLPRVRLTTHIFRASGLFLTSSICYVKKTRFHCTRENESRLKRCSVIRRTHSRWRLLQINHDPKLIRNMRSAFCDVIFVSSETAKSIEELVNCIEPNRHTSHRLPHAFDFFSLRICFYPVSNEWQ